MKERIEFAKAILEITLPPEVLARIDLDRLRVEDGSFIGDDLKEDLTDILFSVPGRAGGVDRNIYLLFEHKSKVDKKILLQFLRYIVAIHDWQEVLMPVVPVVFYHGEDPWNVPRSMHEGYGLSERQVKEFGHEVLNYEYQLLDVSRLDIQGMRQSLAFQAFLNILAWIRDSERISEFLRIYRDLFFEESERKFIKKLLRYIYGTRKLKPAEFRAVIESNVSPEMGYLAMTTAEELKMEGKLEMAKSLIEQGIAIEVVLKSSGLTLEQLHEAKIVS
jgi:predicted transposase/invertase (TIGR01784 family)